MDPRIIPGAWSAVENPAEESCTVVDAANPRPNGAPDSVCRLIGPMAVSRGRLIAAAAEMRAVCEQIHLLSHVIESAVRRGDPGFTDEVVALIQANTAAIAKAEGHI